VTRFLLDTNCISELVRPKPNPRVLSWIDTVDEDTLFLSVLTLGEIRSGVAALPVSGRRTQLESWLEIDLPARFAGRVLPIDLNVADRWGRLAASARQSGKPLAIIDGLLAATALEFDLTVVTRNTADFAKTPVEVLDPWN